MFLSIFFIHLTVPLGCFPLPFFGKIPSLGNPLRFTLHVSIKSIFRSKNPKSQVSREVYQLSVWQMWPIYIYMIILAFSKLLDRIDGCTDSFPISWIPKKFVKALIRAVKRNIKIETLVHIKAM